MKSFWMYWGLLSVVIIASIFGVDAFVSHPSFLFHPVLALLYVLFFGGFTAGLHLFYNKLAESRAGVFVNAFLGATAVKMFAGLMLLTVTVYFNRDMKIPLALFFLTSYFMFTVLEVMDLLAFNRRHS